MKKIKFSRIISTLIVAASLITNYWTATVFASEAKEPAEIIEAADTLEPRAGTETLPLGWYTISSKFSIKGHNTTTVSSQTIAFDLGYAGRKVQIYTYIENAWSSTEHTASTVTFTDYQSYVYN